MAKKLEKRMKFLSRLDVSSEHIEHLKKDGTKITRDTFKRYVEPSELSNVETGLGYSNKHGGVLAKDNAMIEYWKYKLPEINREVMVYRPSEFKLYVFS